MVIGKYPAAPMFLPYGFCTPCNMVEETLERPIVVDTCEQTAIVWTEIWAFCRAVASIVFDELLGFEACKSVKL